MYINTFKYTPKDVSCQLCTEYVKKLGCTALRCPWLAERIEAGVVGYREAVLETFPHERRLFQRLNLLIKHYPGSLWSNEQHERRMQYQCAVQGYRRRRDRLYYLRGLADRFIYITGGKVEKDYSVAEFESLTEQQRAKLGLRTFILEDLLPPKALPQAGQQMELHNFCFAYKNEPETLHIRESKIPANRIVGIIGNNGAGKSTFSRCFCGLEKRCGEVIWNGRTYRPKDRLNTCYMVMQEVNHQLFTETVLDEVLISMEEENQEWAEEILAELDLIGFKDRHPMSLSGGQKQRVAIASAIASKRSILFFDEPTSGLDYKHMKEVANVLKQVRDAGITLYVITHDLELLLDCCTDIVHFEDGSIIDKFQMDEAGLEKIRNYFIKGVPTK